MDPSVQRLQFLDLTDVSENDQSLIERVLFSTNQTLNIPWFTGKPCRSANQSGSEWIPPPYNNVEGQHDLQTNKISEDGEEIEDHCGRDEEQEQDGDGQGSEDHHHPQDQPPRQAGIFTGHPPTSLPHQQMYHMVPSLSNVYVSNVTANVSVHPPYMSPIPAHYGPQMPPPQQQPPQQQVFSHPPQDGDQGNRLRRPRHQKDKKRDGPYVQTEEVMSPSLDNHPPHQFANIPLPPYYIPATATPLYMPQVVPVYPPIFNPYSPSSGLVYPQVNNMQPGTEEYHENVQQNYHPGGAEMVVVENMMGQEAGAERRGPDGTEASSYQIEDQPPESYHNDPRLESFKSGNENAHFSADSGLQAEHLQQNGSERLVRETGEEKYESNVIEAGIAKSKNYDLKEVMDAGKGTQSEGESSQIPTGKVDQYGQTVGEIQEQPCGHAEVVKIPRNKVIDVHVVKLNNDVNSVDNVSVNNHMNSTAGRIADDTGGQGKLSPGEINKNKGSSAQRMKMITNIKQESPVPIAENNDFPSINQNAKSTRIASSPEPMDGKGDSSCTTPQNSTASAGKSWASLFDRPDQFNLSPLNNNRVRPMARVSPYHEVEGAPGNIGTASASTPASIKTDRNSPKSNGTLSKKSVPVVNAVNDPYLHLLGEFLCNYELDHKIVNLQPRGLTNRSNWCYINAIMQSLIVCPAFYNLLKALPVKMKRRGSSQTLIIDALVDFVNEFNLIPSNARIGKREKSARNKEDSTNSVEIAAGPAFEPSGIYKVLHKIRGESSFNIEGRQEDAEEFLSGLLNGLNDEMFELMKMVDSNKTLVANGDSNGTMEEGEDDDTEWNVMGPKNKSSVTRRAVCGKTPVSDIFRGQVRSRVQRAGDQSTDTVQPFFTLQLDVEKANSVKDALDLLVGKDPLEGVTCTRTHQEVEAWTQMSLEDLPLVLILHLKCFDYKSDGCTKIIKSVDFSVDLKVDAKLLSNRNKYMSKQRSYKLVAVVYHDGKEASKGHYVTDAYHVGYGCWLRYDDGVVRSVPEAHVLKPRLPRVPYLLYYRRTDTIGTTK